MPSLAEDQRTQRTRKTQQEVVAFLGVATVSAIGWLGWLGWHEPRHRTPGTQLLEGPYASMQVIAYAATVAVAVATATWFGHRKASVLGGSIGTTLVFSFDAGTAPSSGADILLAGAVMLTIGTTEGLRLLAFVVDGARARLAARRTH